ncbi:MAG: translation initiation factor 2 [Lysinibacillus sp.]
MIDNKKNANKPPESLEITAARISLIGTSISALGDAIQVIAAGLSLDALLKPNTGDEQSQNNDAQQIENIQKQVDYLINELKQIKKSLR